MSSLPLTHSTPANIIRLSGRTLAVARSLWLAVSVAATLTFLVALPFRWAMWAHPSPTNLASLTALGLRPAIVATCSVFWEIVIAAPYVIVGLIIFWWCGEERIALLTSLVLVVFGVGSGTITPTILALLGLHPALDLLQHTFEFIAWYGFALFFYLFPNGRFVPGWTRWLAAIWLPICIAWNFASDTPFAPLNWPLWLFVSVVGLYWASWMFSQVYRYWRVSNAVERQQTKWIVFAVVTIILSMAVTSIIGAFVPGYDLMSEGQPTPPAIAYMFWQWLLSSVMAALPVAIAFSIMRHRLWDIDRLISRALVYGALTAFVVVAYAVVVDGLGALFQSSGNVFISLLATGLIAVAFQSLRDRLQRAVNRLMYGERDDPYAVLSRLGQRLEATLAPDSILPAIVETLAQTLRLPYAAIRLNDDSLTSRGALPPNTQPASFPLAHQGETVGQLIVAPRAADEPFTAAERRLLADIARQAGIAAHAVRLTTDLLRSRERLVAAREEERRRLRNDLHDGVGPQLASLSLHLETARNRLADHPLACALLDELSERARAVIADIRRAVYALRPPALDDLGLASALREEAAQYSSVRISADVPDDLPPLPAAVEVAVYRIVQEALANVVRHARAQSAHVQLRASPAAGQLRLEIADDGCGLPTDQRAGVGLRSIRDRTAELGGTLSVESGAGSGTCLNVTLPYALCAEPVVGEALAGAERGRET